MGTKVEISVDNIPSLESAIAFGASSLDLCSSLCLGGLTPSAGFVQKCLDMSPIPLHIFIRPRTGNFIYTDEEVDVMVSDIKFMQLLGVKGVSFAALKSDGSLDEFALKRLLRAAEGLEVTFHRAFDLCPFEDKLMRIIKLGFSRVVTTHLKETCAFDIADDIVIMPTFTLNEDDLSESLDSINTAQVLLTPLSVELNQQQLRFTLTNACEQECESCQANIASYELNEIIK